MNGGGEFRTEAVSNAGFTRHDGGIGCWLKELQASKFYDFVIHFIEIVFSVFMMPTRRPDLYFHYLVDIISFC